MYQLKDYLNGLLKTTKDLTIFCLQKTHFRYKIGGLKVKEWEDLHHENINQKKPEVAIVMSGQLTSEERKLLDEHYIMKKSLIFQEDIILNDFESNCRASTYMK